MSANMEVARRRQLQQSRLQCLLEYPLVFDNSRWAPRSQTTHSADAAVDLSTKNKFFGALIKPCVSNASYVRLVSLVASW